jgi:hypothetical protein
MPGKKFVFGDGGDASSSSSGAASDEELPVKKV